MLFLSRELVSFDPWHVTCHPPIGKHISVMRCNNDLFFTYMEHNHGVVSLFQALGSWGRAKTSEEKTRED